MIVWRDPNSHYSEPADRLRSLKRSAFPGRQRRREGQRDRRVEVPSRRGVTCLGRHPSSVTCLRATASRCHRRRTAVAGGWWKGGLDPRRLSSGPLPDPPVVQRVDERALRPLPDQLRRSPGASLRAQAEITPAPRALRRASRQARERGIPGSVAESATPREGMHRRPNAEVILVRALGSQARGGPSYLAGGAAAAYWLPVVNCPGRVAPRKACPARSVMPLKVRIR